MPLQGNFIEITLRHVCSPVNLLHIFITPFFLRTSRGVLLLDLEPFQTFMMELFTKIVLTTLSQQIFSQKNPS